jgi:Asp-tRNA(Asn)/Glu-tRNA(Gln) amidotransferase C subunit
LTDAKANSKPIDAATVAALAQLMDLELSAARLAQVMLQLQRIQAVAAPVLDAPLEPQDEQAPVWRP